MPNVYLTSHYLDAWDVIIYLTFLGILKRLYAKANKLQKIAAEIGIE